MSVGLSGRVVAVTADRGAGAPGGRYAYGSGCLVNGTTVLTAAHVVAGAQSVSIRTSTWVKHEATVDPDFIGDPSAWHPDHPSAPDLTLLTLATSLEMPRMPVARVNRGHKAGLIERARSLGYPWFGEQELPGEGPVRVQAPVVGQLLLSEREDGRLDFQVTIAPPEALSGSQWAGMSGAPVTASGRLIGVITEHPGRSGASTITVTPLTALHADTVHPGWGSGVPDPEAWWARLGIADPDKLAVLPAAAEAEYRATLREIGRELQQRVPVLEGRDTELTAIGDFATGKEGYRWLMGDAFTGKTALIHRATTAALPDNVDVVAYFLRRTASDANSVKFLAAVTSQLRALLGPETAVAPGLDEHAFRWLWEQAAIRGRQGGRHLLLVVDGLDEDTYPATTPSVASLLPDFVCGQDPAATHAHVHVSSRSYYRRPVDLMSNTHHPLNHTPRIRLGGFKGWQELRDLGTAEIDELTLGGDVELDVFGLLTAARGPLSPRDLAAMHTHPLQPKARDRSAVRAVLQRAARSLEPVGSPDQPRYQFAHTTLLEHAYNNEDLADPEYRTRIHAWADDWRDAGWPDPDADGTGTPRYLLDTYPATLAADDSRERLTALVVDVGWVNTAIRAIGVDATRADLRNADTGQDESVTRMRAVVAAQTDNLRPPSPVIKPGYVLRQLCLQALRYGNSELAAAARARLEAMSRPGPIPCWTSHRVEPPALELGSHSAKVDAIVVTSSGHIVSSAGSEVRIWDRRRPGEVSELGGARFVRALAALADGTVVGSDGLRRSRILAWNPERASRPRLVGTQVGQVRLAVTPDGDRIVSGGGDGRVLIWDLAGADVVVSGQGKELSGQSGWVTALDVAKNGRVYCAWSSGRLGTYSLERSVHPIWLSEDSVAASIAVAPSGEWVVTGGDDGRVRIWYPGHPDAPVELGSHEGAVTAVAVGPSGEWVVTGGDDGRVRVWRIASELRTAVLTTHSSTITAMATLPDGGLVTGDDRGLVRLWMPDQPDAPTDLGRHDFRVSSISAAPDSARVVTGGADGRILVWDLHQQGASIELGSHPPIVASVAWMSGTDGEWVVSGGDFGDGRVLAWRLDQPNQPRELGKYEVDAVRALSVSADGRFLVAGGEGLIPWVPSSARLWLIEQPDDPIEVADLVGSVAALLTTGANFLVVGQSVVEWDPLNPGEARELGAMHGGTAAATSPDHQWIIIGDGGGARLWDSPHRDQPVAEIRMPTQTMAIGSTASVSYVAIGGIGLTLFRLPSTDPR